MKMVEKGNIKPIVTAHDKTRRGSLTWVRLDLDGDAYYLDRAEAFDLADKLVDAAEKIPEWKPC